MTDMPVLRQLADVDPVPDPAAYDETAERHLQMMLATLRAQPGEGAPGRRHRSGRARNRRVWWMATASATIAAACAAVILTAGDRVSRGSATRGAHMQSVRLVAERTGAALASASDYILKQDETVTSADGAVHRSQAWLDQSGVGNLRSLDESATGTPAFEISTYIDPDGTVTDLQIDYATHQYTRDELTAAQAAHGLADALARKRAASGASTTTPRSERRPSKQSDQSQAQDIRAALANGTDRLLGATTLVGRHVLLLSNDEPGMNREIWIDPSNYLPVQMTAHGQFGSYVITYTWIARTAQTLRAAFLPAIPDGFAQVAQITGG